MLASDLHRLLSETAVLLRGRSVADFTPVAGRQPLESLLAEDDGGRRPLSSRALIHLLGEVYGGATAGMSLRRLGALCERFLELYGDGPVELLRAPARINILGEHVDYVSYLPTSSLPFGSREHDMLMLYRAAAGGRVRGASTHADYPPFEFSLDEGPPAGGGEAGEGEWVSYLYEVPPPAPHWGNYVKGSCFFARVKYGRGVARGYDFIVDSSIPPKGGASSSSALVVLAGAAVRTANAVACDRGELALDSSKAEWYVGTRGGSMDHLTICLAERERAVHISYGEQRARLLPLPGGRLRWATFFSHPADKGREIMLEYNERAAVSRLLIPAIIEGWRLTSPQRHADWSRALEALRARAEGAADEVRSLLGLLPETITLEEVERDHAEVYRRCADAFPALVAERRQSPLRVRAYALHHLGEVMRVATAARLLAPRPGAGEQAAEDSGQVVSRLGALLKESHESLRDLYGVSTLEVEALVGVILADPHVYGARLMGGGFGGNVLALTTAEHLPALAARVQREFYEPRGRDGSREGAVMVSTPGDGLSALSVDTVRRRAVEEFNSLGREAERYRRRVCELLDEVEGEAATREVWPLIVAAGKGSRARESGLDVPKPVAPVAGVPAILRVLRSLREACGGARAPVVIVSPETERAVREALAGEDAVFVTQPEPRGTGDAVLHARAVLEGFGGRAVVIWGTQPVVRARTITRALRLAALFEDSDMVLPTALRQAPYAPVERDARGRVAASRETHLEGASRPAFGETNVGLFVLHGPAMFEALAELRRRHWREGERRYGRPGGELGFPNEMINYMAGRGAGVTACPFVDWREGQGIKTLEDVALCERYLSELGGEEG